MFDYIKEFTNAVGEFRKKYPTTWWVFSIIAVTSVIISVSVAINNSWIALYRGTAVSIAIALSAIIFYFLGKIKTESRSSNLLVSFSRIVSLSSVVVFSFLYLIWLSLTATVTFSELGLVCEPVETDQQTASDAVPADFLASLLRFVGVEPVEKRECGHQKHLVELNISPVISAGGINVGDEIDSKLPFSYRRSSCSGRSSGEFVACLPQGAEVKTVQIDAFSARNGQFEPVDGGTAAEVLDTFPENANKPMWRRDLSRPECAIIPWSAASGGRTGIGECRYHGSINFETTLSGNWTKEVIEAINGSERPKIDTVIGRLRSYSASGVLPGSANVERWKYSVKVSQIEKNISREHTVWVDEADNVNNSTECLDTSVDAATGMLFVRLKC